MNTLLSYEISWNKPPEAGQEFVVVVSMVRNKVGFLLNKKRGTWEFPGGHKESFDGSWREAIEREYKEESGVEINGSLDYAFSIENIDSSSRVRSYCHVFINILENEPQSNLEYFDEIPSPTSLPHNLYSLIVAESRKLYHGLYGSNESWEQLSPSYRTQSLFSISDVHYGPCVAGEDKYQLLGEIKGKRVLDIGCGIGHNSLVLAGKGAQVTAIDRSKRQLEYAHDLSKQMGASVDYRELSMDNLNTGLGKFDIVFSVFALQFSIDIDKVFRETYNLLTEGGCIIFSLPNIPDNFPVGEKTMLVNKSWGDDIPNMAIRYYDVNYIVSLLKKHGFTSIEVIYPQYTEDGKVSPYSSEYYKTKLKNMQRPYTVIIKGYKYER